MITPNHPSVTNVLVNFLTDKEIDATRGEAVERKNRLLKEILQVSRELQESVETQRLNAELHAAKKRYQGAQRALKEYEKIIRETEEYARLQLLEKLPGPHPQQLTDRLKALEANAEKRRRKGAKEPPVHYPLRATEELVTHSAALSTSVTPLSRARGYQPPEDPERQRLLQELREAHERMVVAEEACRDFPLYKILQDIRRELECMEDILTARPDSIILNLLKKRDEVHGITRERIAVILNAIVSGQSVSEEMFTEEPSLYKEIKDYLARHRIVDRISYEVKIFGYNEEGTNWYRHCGVRGLFPKNLAFLLLRGNREYLTAADLIKAGDMLYGQLDKNAVVAELRESLSSHGIHNGDELRAADYRRTVLPILEASRFRSMNMVCNILGRGEYLRSLKFEERKMLLAQLIYGEGG